MKITSKAIIEDSDEELGEGSSSSKIANPWELKAITSGI
jgi:hypothetical protein